MLDPPDLLRMKAAVDHIRTLSEVGSEVEGQAEGEDEDAVAVLMDST